MRTLIEGGTVIGFHKGGHVVIAQGQVVYRDNQIEFVGRGYDGAVDARIDAHGKLVIPGLVNHHMAFGVHMQIYRLDFTRRHFFNSDIGFGVRPELAYAGGGVNGQAVGPAAADWRASAEYAMITALRTGSTTFVMVPNYGRHPYRGRVGDDQELVDMVGSTGLRGYLALPYMSGAVQGRANGTIEWVLREADGWEGLAQGIEFARQYNGVYDDRIRTFLFPCMADNCTADLLMASKKAAQELGTFCKMHTSQYLLDFHQILRATAKTPIQWLYDIGFLGPDVSLAHAIFTTRHPWLAYPVDDDADTQLLAESGATVAHCPVVYGRLGVALHSFSHYVRSGVTVSLGTDTSPQDMFMEMQAASLLSKLSDADPRSGLAREVFDAATLGGAKALGREDIGRLTPGAKADIVLVDTEKIHIGPVAADDPIKALVYCAYGDDVDTVIIDGVTRVQGGEVLGVDLEALRSRANQFNTRLWLSVRQTTYQGRPLTDAYRPAFPDWRS